uniref:Pentatricopeptide repeat-containing protein n=1 Tax=Aegilops tauschii subsp. strangulata TaxID=200361 RepID=A0A453K640_AEGTS
MAITMASTSSPVAALKHPHFLDSKPLKPLKRARTRSCALADADAAAAAPRTSQAELRPDSKNAPALSLLDHLSHRGVPASPSAFTALLSACRSLAHARQIHAHLRVHGLDSNEFLLARLVEVYLAVGAAEEARQVLGGLPRASAFSWNALLHGHVRRGRREAGDAVAGGFLWRC